MKRAKSFLSGRILCAFCGAYTAGIAFSALTLPSLVIIAVTLSAFLFAVALKKLPYFFILFVICTAFFTGCVHFNFTKTSYNNFLDKYSGRYLTLSGKITEISETDDGRQCLTVNADSFECLGKTVDKKLSAVLYTDKNKKFSVGDKITFSDILSPVTKLSSHSYDYDLQLRTKDISACFNLSSKYITINGGSHTLMDKIRIFSENLSEKIQTTIGGEEGSVARAIVLGDKSDFTKELNSIFSKSGISHIVAVSGMHLSILASFLFFIFSRLRLNYKLRNIITILIILFYMALTGFSPSVTRAGIMVICVLFSTVIGAQNDRLTSLFLSAAIILMVNPYAILSAGFLLSYLAIAGIFIFASPIKARIKWSFIPEFMKTIIASSISANLLTFPVVTIIFGSFYPYSVISNLIILPFVSIIFITTVLSLMLPSILSFVPRLLINVLLTCGKFFASLPYSAINIKAPGFLDFILYGVVLLIIYLVLKGKLTGRLMHYSLSAITCYTVLMLTISSVTYSVTFLDVGQGDCALVKTPGNHNYLVDTGPSGNTTLSALKSYGINNLDIIFISHSDNDHCGALEEIITNIPTNKIVLPYHNITDDKMVKITNTALDNNISVEFVNNKFDYNLSGLYADVLWPSNKTDKGLDENDGSLVMKIRVNKNDYLFTGDVGFSPEENIMDFAQTDVLKVSHHGSGDATSEKFLRHTEADYSVISVGRNNKYGHPDEELIKRLEDTDTTILRTDILTDICFTSDIFGNTRISYGG